MSPTNETSHPDASREFMDLSGVPCPDNFARILVRMEWMDEGDLLEVLVDDGEPIENVPPAVEDEGHAILEKERTPAGGWRLLIRRA